MQQLIETLKVLFSTQNVLIGLLSLFGLAFLIQMIYYFSVYIRVGFHGRRDKPTIKQEPISVVVCAKNQAENLRNFLPLILKQNYPDFEVIVVNDCSEDETEAVLEQLKNEYSNLYVSTIRPDPKFTHGKKLALTIGIKAAKHDILVLTDADCYPASENWLSKIQRNFTENTEIVIGYGGYEKGHGSKFLNSMIRYETNFIASQYLGFSLAGTPYMGVGRNLAYRKSLFFSKKGFAGHAHLLSGDDDLFINNHATGKNTRTEIHPDSFTFSIPKKSFEDWKFQKKRHFSTYPYYKFKFKFLLFWELFSRLLFFATFIPLMFFGFFRYIALGVFLLRWLIQFLILRNNFRLFTQKDVVVVWFLFDIILPFVNYRISFSNSLTHTKKWK